MLRFVTNSGWNICFFSSFFYMLHFIWILPCRKRNEDWFWFWLLVMIEDRSEISTGLSRKWKWNGKYARLKNESSPLSATSPRPQEEERDEDWKGGAAVEASMDPEFTPTNLFPCGVNWNLGTQGHFSFSRKGFTRCRNPQKIGRL